MALGLVLLVLFLTSQSEWKASRTHMDAATSAASKQMRVEKHRDGIKEKIIMDLMAENKRLEAEREQLRRVLEEMQRRLVACCHANPHLDTFDSALRPSSRLSPQPLDDRFLSSSSSSASASASSSSSSSFSSSSSSAASLSSLTGGSSQSLMFGQPEVDSPGFQRQAGAQSNAGRNYQRQQLLTRRHVEEALAGGSGFEVASLEQGQQQQQQQELTQQLQSQVQQQQLQQQVQPHQTQVQQQQQAGGAMTQGGAAVIGHMTRFRGFSQSEARREHQQRQQLLLREQQQQSQQQQPQQQLLFPLIVQEQKVGKQVQRQAFDHQQQQLQQQLPLQQGQAEFLPQELKKQQNSYVGSSSMSNSIGSSTASGIASSGESSVRSSMHVVQESSGVGEELAGMGAVRYEEESGARQGGLGA
ncbi:hypothetical protein CLOM_g16256 [Closterium sp. NIES-68]|nr:hypothetical protein CLOM_g16256 [Closterium sp. NIES-68]GJP67452.1 hypothetical protein CLOP_g24273 [Closterium sp. NIES-67]